MPAASRIVHLATIVGIVGLVGCPGPDSTPPEQASSTEPAVASQASEASSSEAAPPEKPATLEALNPRIVEVGEAGRAPDRIEIRFAQPVVAEANRQASKETDVTIKPSLTGSWTFTDRSTLTFKPSVGFAPDTEYLVVLKSLQSGTAGQPIVGQRNYQRVFTTPSLTLQRMDLIGWNAAEGRAEVSLVFTGPVRFGLRRKAISWSIDSIPRKISVTRGPRLNVWTAVITDRGLRPGSVIDASVASRKVMSLAEFGKYASGSASVSLPKDKAVFIRGAAVVEGTDGFFLRVVCHDEASRGRSIRFWDSQLRERFRLSPRCVLDEESVKSKITLDPPSELRISPTRGGFRVHAPFARGPVKVVIEPGARSVDGGVTASRFTRTLTIPARSPKLEFVAQGRYLPPSAWGTMAVRHQNISRPKLQIRHVTKDNIVRWLADSGEGTTYKNSDLVVERSIKLDGKPDVLETMSLSLKNILPKPPAGVVEIRIFDRDAYSARSTVRFAVTDLNILAKRHRDGTVRAWVLNAHDHTPVANATVEMVVYSGRTISTCQTDGDGGCALSGIETDAVDKTEPFALLARSGEDFTFINFNQLALDTSGFDVQGVSSSESNPYRTAVYADRGVYRPGETAHVVAVVRTDENKAPPEGMPVVVELYDPKRKVSRRLALKTNEAGMVNADFTFADFADTGRYRADFKAGKLLIGQYSFNVEEFVPERMEVTASTAKVSFGTDDDAQINVSARYLFGGSAAGSRYDVRCRLAPARFAPKQHVGYAFDVWRDGSAPTIQLGQVSGTLGAEGKDEISCPGLTSRGKLMSTARLTAQVAVFESGSGRTTQGSASALVHPAPMYIGLKTNVQNVSVNKTFTVEGVVVDWSGELLTSVDEVDIELLKVEREYGWVYDDYEGRWTSRRHSHLVSTRTTKTKVNDGRFKLELKTTESSPAYVVRARAGDTVVSDLRLGGTWSYWWYYNSTSDATPRPLKPEALQIKAPTKTRVGEPVEVSVNVPHAGRLLWTLETDGVKKAEWQTVEGPGEVRWSFEVDEFEPNVYVSALLLKDPHEESKQSFLPSRLYGVRSIRVLPERYLQTVTIKAPDEVRSNQPLEIELALPEAERPTYVTVAAVDEGILSLTKFRTPDLAKTLFKRRRLGVGTFETIGWNVSLPAGDLGRSTGGDAPGGPGRVQMVKPVAMWSGVLKVPDKGPLKVKFDVPRYRGKLRIMVVGAGSERLVSAEKSVLVRDPIVLQTTLPRFLVQGDEVQVPVFLTNLSGKAQKVSVRLQSRSMPQPGSGSLKSAPNPVKVNGPAVREIELEKDGQATIIYRLSAEAAVGAARLEVQAEAPGIKVSESIDVPFTPNAPRAKRVQRIPLPTGDVDLKPYLKGWMPTTESSTFWVTSNPYGEALDHLKYLIRYPYGCIEQTTSATRPLLFLGGLVRNVDPDQVRREQARKRDPRRNRSGAQHANAVRRFRLLAGGFASRVLGHGVRNAPADRCEEEGLRRPPKPNRRCADLDAPCAQCAVEPRACDRSQSLHALCARARGPWLEGRNAGDADVLRRPIQDRTVVAQRIIS